MVRSWLCHSISSRVPAAAAATLQVRGLLELPPFQVLLAAACAPDTLVLLVPPFAPPGQPAPDDGTRLLCSDRGLEDAFSAVLKFFKHEVLKARSVEDRVAEVHQMVRHRATGMAAPPAGPD